MKEWMTISEIAKFTNVSIDTLKHYDKIGIFKPDYINKENAYRYYSYKQIYTLELIHDLRALEIPLSDIREYLAHLRLESSIDVLERKIEETTAVIEALKRQNNLLTAKVNKYKTFRGLPSRFYTFHEKILDDRKILTLGTVLHSDFDRVYASTCLENITNEKSPGFLGYSLGALVPLTSNLDLVAEDLISIMLLDRQTDYPYPSEYIKTLPGGKYVCLFVNGKIMTFNKHIEKIKHYAQENQLKLDDHIVLYSIIDEMVTSDENEMVYEIQVKVL